MERASREGVLIAGVCLAWAGLAAVVVPSPEFRSFFAPPPPHHQVSHGQQAPKYPAIRVGDHVQLPAADVDGRLIGGSNRASRTLVAYLTNCSACRADSVHPSKIEYAAYDQVVLVPPEEFDPKDLAKTLPHNARILIDSDEIVARAVAANSPPKYVILDGRSIAVEVQATPGVLPEFVRIREEDGL